MAAETGERPQVQSVFVLTLACPGRATLEENVVRGASPDPFNSTKSPRYSNPPLYTATT